MELLYTIQHKVGAESQLMGVRVQPEELVAYGKKAFHVTDEQHVKLVGITNNVKVNAVADYVPGPNTVVSIRT